MMRMLFHALCGFCLVPSVVLAAPSNQLISIDFNNTSSGSISAVGTMVGDYDSASGVDFVGQIGPWNAFDLGTQDFDLEGRIDSERSTGPLTTGSGELTTTTFRLNSDGASVYTTGALGVDPLLGDCVALDDFGYFQPATSTDLEWSIDNLIPGNLYDIKMYSPFPGYDVFSIGGSLFPADADRNTLMEGIAADSNGQIVGLFTQTVTPIPIPYWSGLQIRGEFPTVPEPATLLLVSLGMALSLRRRR